MSVLHSNREGKMKHSNDGYFIDCIADLWKKIPTDWAYTASPNDAAPSYGVNGLTIFTDHPDPAKREDSEWARFSVWDDEQNILFETDSFDELVKFVEGAK